MDARGNAQAGILDLIGDVYDAALDERLWPGLAPRIARTFGSPSTAVQVRDIKSGRINGVTVTGNYDRAASEAYLSYYGERDVWLQRAAAMGSAQVLASKDLIADREFERTEFYNDFLRTHGVFYVVGAAFPVDGDALCVVGIQRPRDGRAYDEEDKTRVTQFLPHLRRALQIRKRLADPAIERGAAIDVLERSGIATLVLTGDGRLLYANDHAERLLRAGDAVRIVGGRLAAADRAAAERLTVLIRACANTASGKGGGAGGAFSIARGSRLPLTVLVAPFRPARDGLGARLPATILFLRDPESPSPKSLALQGLFGLTAAEATVAAELAAGKGVDDLAVGLGITLNTVRAHLKNIFAKTGTGRQAQLVSLILASVAVLMSG